MLLVIVHYSQCIIRHQVWVNDGANSNDNGWGTASSFPSLQQTITVNINAWALPTGTLLIHSCAAAGYMGEIYGPSWPLRVRPLRRCRCPRRQPRGRARRGGLWAAPEPLPRPVSPTRAAHSLARSAAFAVSAASAQANGANLTVTVPAYSTNTITAPLGPQVETALVASDDALINAGANLPNNYGFGSVLQARLHACASAPRVDREAPLGVVVGALGDARFSRPGRLRGLRQRPCCSAIALCGTPRRQHGPLCPSRCRSCCQSRCPPGRSACPTPAPPPRAHHAGGHVRDGDSRQHRGFADQVRDPQHARLFPGGRRPARLDPAFAPVQSRFLGVRALLWPSLLRALTELRARVPMASAVWPMGKRHAAWQHAHLCQQFEKRSGSDRRGGAHVTCGSDAPHRPRSTPRAAPRRAAQ